LADLELVVACWCFSLVVLGGNLLVGGDQWFPWLGRDNLLAAVVYSAGTAWENVKFLGCGGSSLHLIIIKIYSEAQASSIIIMLRLETRASI